jgi:septum formation topological specificity factor MinE
MFNTIQQESKSDNQLAKLLVEAREYAQVYVLARQRQKGCDGMGELATMKEECRDVIDKVIQYSQEKKYISQSVSYDIESIADEIVKGRYPL